VKNARASKINKGPARKPQRSSNQDVGNISHCHFGCCHPVNCQACSLCSACKRHTPPYLLSQFSIKQGKNGSHREVNLYLPSETETTTIHLLHNNTSGMTKKLKFVCKQKYHRLIAVTLIDLNLLSVINEVIEGRRKKPEYYVQKDLVPSSENNSWTLNLYSVLRDIEAIPTNVKPSSKKRKASP